MSWQAATARYNGALLAQDYDDRDLTDIEVVVERKLLDQSLAQVVVVVDDQDLACAHRGSSVDSGGSSGRRVSPTLRRIIQIRFATLRQANTITRARIDVSRPGAQQISFTQP